MIDAVMISGMVRRDYSQEAKMTTKADRESPLWRQLIGRHRTEYGVAGEEGSLKLTIVGRGREATSSMALPE